MNPFALPFYPSGTPGRVSPALSLLHGSDSLSDSPTYKPSSAPIPGTITGIGQNLNQMGQENAQFCLMHPRDLKMNSLQAFHQVSPRAQSHQATMNYNISPRTHDTAKTTPRSPSWTSATATPPQRPQKKKKQVLSTSAIPPGRSRKLIPEPNHPSLAPVFNSLEEHWAQVPPTIISPDEFKDGLIRLVVSYAVDPDAYEDLNSRNFREELLQGLHAHSLGAWHSCMQRIRSSKGLLPKQPTERRRHAFAFTAATVQGPHHSGPPKATTVALEELEQQGSPLFPQVSLPGTTSKDHALGPADPSATMVTPDASINHPTLRSSILKTPPTHPETKDNLEIKHPLDEGIVFGGGTAHTLKDGQAFFNASPASPQDSTSPARSPTRFNGWNALATPLRVFNTHVTRALDSLLRPTQKRPRQDTSPDKSEIPNSSSHSKTPSNFSTEVRTSDENTDWILGPPPATPQISDNIFFSESENLFSETNSFSGSPPDFLSPQESEIPSATPTPPNSIFRKPPPNSQFFFFGIRKFIFGDKFFFARTP